MHVVYGGVICLQGGGSMAACANCGTTIFFGKRSGDYRFCNKQCSESAQFILIGDQLPDDLIERTALEWHSGTCPKCNGPGPVDVHTYHTIWSVILFTQKLRAYRRSHVDLAVSRVSLGALSLLYCLGGGVSLMGSL